MGVASLARVERDRFDLELARPLVEPNLAAEIFFRPFVQIGIRGRALLLALEGRGSTFHAHAHQAVQAFFLGPQQLGPGIHGGLLPQVELTGVLLAGRIVHVGIDRLPLVPQRHVVGPVLDGAENARGPARRAIQFQGQGIAVQGRGQIDDVGLRRTGLEQRTLKPAVGTCPLEGRYHVAVVLQIVADDQCRPGGPKAFAAQPLSDAEGLDPHLVGKFHDGRSPRRPACLVQVIAVGKPRVLGQFRFDVFQMEIGLMPGVGDNPDVRLPAFERGCAARRPGSPTSTWLRRADR